MALHTGGDYCEQLFLLGSLLKTPRSEPRAHTVPGPESVQVCAHCGAVFPATDSWGGSGFPGWLHLLVGSLEIGWGLCPPQGDKGTGQKQGPSLGLLGGQEVVTWPARNL